MIIIGEKINTSIKAVRSAVEKDGHGSHTAAGQKQAEAGEPLYRSVNQAPSPARSRN